MPTGSVKLAGVQFAGLPEQKGRNTDRAFELIMRAARQDAQIIVTPEVVLSGFVGGDREMLLAEPIPGPATEAFGDLARELGVYLLVGLSELRDGQILNAMATLNPEGQLMGVMRKVHINRFETGRRWRNGADFPVWDFATATGRLRGGTMICYDRELPESARLLMLQGADVIFMAHPTTVLLDGGRRWRIKGESTESGVCTNTISLGARGALPP